MRRLRLALASWLACSVAAQRSPRIVNGQTAVEFSLPYQVSLNWRDSAEYYFSHTCGGSLIHASWVLTAATRTLPITLTLTLALTLTLTLTRCSRRRAATLTRTPMMGPPHCPYGLYAPEAQGSLPREQALLYARRTRTSLGRAVPYVPCTVWCTAGALLRTCAQAGQVPDQGALPPPQPNPNPNPNPNQMHHLILTLT